ncbi:C-C chemokine receptor type 1-like isoform X2 [Paralichthys olivaceus]|uniref:C-C chemokine receptor type 1-like isoform X2 n=1 Tax=Paralichthys olivaceus TaxID=8255 RepID=UPI00097DB0E1|nr:PREDICTED: C-C chemokine receptor type 1-like [Paralichthys olivaceus]
MSDLESLNHESTTFDYSDYYSDSPTLYHPCNDVDLMNFGRVFLPTLYSLVCIVGFLGNGLVVCLLVKHRNHTTLTDICLFNLAFSDLVFLLTLPFYAHYSMINHWIFGDFMCRFMSTCHYTGYFSSVFFMVVMTLDRYVVIVHIHRAAGYRTLRAGVVLSMSIWLLSLGVSLPGFIFSKVTDNFNYSSCSQDLENSTWNIYNIIVTNIVGLVIPLLVMVVCYSKIIPTLMNMRSVKRHRAVKLIVFLVAAFFFLWVPFNICSFLYFLKSTYISPNECHTDLKLSLIVTETFAYTHCCLNPIIYAFVGQKFMKRALQLLRKWVPGNRTLSTRDLTDSSFRKSSVSSRSSDMIATIII